MSAALESLMRDPPSLRHAEPSGGGIISFLLIGGGAALGFIALSTALVSVLPMVDGWVVSAACYAAFILPVYLLHRRFTFISDAAHRQALPRYVAVQGMAMLLASLFSFVFHGAFHMPSLPAAMLVVALTSGVNYLVLKGWAFAFVRRVETAPA